MPNINAEIRDMSVKLEELRSKGAIPTELYGKGIDNIHLAVDAKAFAKVLEEAGENTIVNVMIDGNTHPVLIHDYQVNPISRKYLAVDLREVNMSEKITAPVPLSFVGESQAVQDGGVLVKSMEEIEIEALPGDLPHEIEVNLSAITEIDGSLYVRDLSIPEKCEVITDPDTVVATVAAPREEEVVEAPVSVEEIVTEGEAKRAEKEKKDTEE